MAIALIDCNNFFVACEQAFNPTLLGKPIIVASSNDGCIVSRSPEVKALGIPMAAPIFKWRDTINAHNVQVLSSNFTLYMDMSRRIMQTIRELGLPMEESSVDECFLEIDDGPDCELLIRDLARNIEKSTGVPVSIGVSATKGLAKLATWVAKKHQAYQKHKICIFDRDLYSPQMHQWLSMIPVESVWGVGNRVATVLKNHNIDSAYQLQQYDRLSMRQRWSKTTAAIIDELNGTQRFPLQTGPRAKRQQVLSSRHFGSHQTNLPTIAAALSHHVAHASHKLRQQGLLAGEICIFVDCASSKFSEKEARNLQAWRTIQPATNHTGQLTAIAEGLLHSVWVNHQSYRKCGVLLNRLIETDQETPNLFLTRRQQLRNNSLMQSIDSLNNLYGSKTIRMARECTDDQSYLPKANRRSQRWTTDWQSLPTALAN